MSEDIATYEFMKVRYTGDLAKNAVALADHGIGYVVLEKGTDRGEKYAVVAYKHVTTMPMTPNVSYLSSEEMRKVERIFNSRINIHENIDSNRGNTSGNGYQHFLTFKNGLTSVGEEIPKEWQ